MGAKISYIDCVAPMDELLAECGPLGDGITVFRGNPAAEELWDLVREAEIVLNGHTKMDVAVLAEAPSLRSIVFLGTGASSYVDMADASRRGIAVRVVKNYGDRTVAEHAFGLLLAAARGFARMDRDLRAGIWERQEGIELAGKTLGIVCVDAIGVEMARIAAGFGMHVIAWNRSGVPAGLPCAEMALDEVLAGADAISVHLALTPPTQRFFDAERIRHLNPGCLVVNVARGDLFDIPMMVRVGQSQHD